MPGTEEDVHAFFGGEAANEKDGCGGGWCDRIGLGGGNKLGGGSFGFVGGERSEVDEVGFDDEFVFGKAESEHFLASELAEADEAMYAAVVGAKEAEVEVVGERGDNGAGEGAAVAAVADAGPGEASEAFFADFTVAEEVAVEAGEAVVVEGEDDGDAGAAAGPEDGG